MRQRKLKNEEEKLTAYRRYEMTDPKRYKGVWHEIFGNENGIYIEFGCGKGRFITAFAEKYPDRNYIGIEGHGSVVLRAMEKTAQKELRNVRFIHAFVTDISAYFAEGEVAGIYLNFSDPWPKKRHEKKRLTHRRYLGAYQNILQSGGLIEYKTDSEAFYRFTVDSVLSNNMRILEVSEDLHGSAPEAKKTADAPEAEVITTEYEEKFREMKKKIFYCKIGTVTASAV